MTQQTESQDKQLADFTGLVLVLSLVVIFALVSSNASPARVEEPGPAEDAMAVLQVVPTDTVEATITRPPPTATATARPSDTPVPTATARPSDTPEPAPTADAQVDTNKQDAAVSSADHDYDPALAEQGETLFLLCAACHGPDGRGIQGLGKDLVESEFVLGLTDEALLDFIKTGRPLWDPDNTTGLDMPAKGGNPALTDEDILAIIAYVRSLAAGSE